MWSLRSANGEMTAQLLLFCYDVVKILMSQIKTTHHFSTASPLTECIDFIQLKIIQPLIHLEPLIYTSLFKPPLILKIPIIFKKGTFDPPQNQYTG